MTHFKKWDIVLVPFPFTDLSVSKWRPALIISPEKFNIFGDVVITFLTSNLQVNKKIGDYLIIEWENASLPKPSLIRMKFATLDSKFISKRIGALLEPDKSNFNKELFNFFEFS